MTQKYVICNAYDADSRSLAARTLLERNPHQVIEGILLAAYAVGASEAYLFTRSLFVEGIEAVQQALQEAWMPTWSGAIFWVQILAVRSMFWAWISALWVAKRRSRWP